MNILIVGNVIKDVYLNLDNRTESFESDKDGTKWLDLSFNASEHHFFNRQSSFGGAAVTLEVLQKMGLNSTITGSNIKLGPNGLTTDQIATSYRYILVTDGQPCYFVPSSHQTTIFETPTEPYDYLYIDRSAKLDATAVNKITAYLDISPDTKLVLYVQNLENPSLNQLLHRADLLFYENPKTGSEQALPQELANIDSKKIIFIAENNLSYLNVSEDVAVDRIDILTHLSAYSIAAATILGSFILGRSVEDSLRMAKVNLENSRLDSVLTLDELQILADNISPADDLELIAKNLVLHPKGILAADESGGSIHKKFESMNIPDTAENRRDYRNIFFTTKDLEKYVNGVILFDETARQLADNGQNFVDYLTSKRIIPGIKVDQGLAPLSEIDADIPADSAETYTKGLADLPTRLKEYYQMGLRFAKWRAAFEIRLNDRGDIITPTASAIEANCAILAEYAANCQTAGLVPIVEPEVVYDGNYSIDQCALVTAKILDQLFQKLADFNVNLRACILKCNMILAGKQFPTPSTSSEVGAKTAEILLSHVPAELTGIVFLSGGQTVEEATDHLAAIIQKGPFPWPVTFSFARALQDPALNAWAGDNQNTEKARQAFLDRLIANVEALQESKNN